MLKGHSHRKKKRPKKKYYNRESEAERPPKRTLASESSLEEPRWPLHRSELLGAPFALPPVTSLLFRNHSSRVKFFGVDRLVIGTISAITYCYCNNNLLLTVIGAQAHRCSSESNTPCPFDGKLNLKQQFGVVIM